MKKKGIVCLEEWCYQQQDGEEAIKDIVPVGQVSSPAKGKDLHTHFEQVIEDEAQVDYLMIGKQRSEIIAMFSFNKNVVLIFKSLY